MNPTQIAAMAERMRAPCEKEHTYDDDKQSAANALEAQAAEIIEDHRISNERGNHIEFTLLPQMAALTMQLADRDAEIARLTGELRAEFEYWDAKAKFDLDRQDADERIMDYPMLRKMTEAMRKADALRAALGEAL
jgi:hypothetical protein